MYIKVMANRFGGGTALIGVGRSCGFTGEPSVLIVEVEEAAPEEVGVGGKLAS